MRDLCREVQKFISACEGVQSLLARGGTLTADEKDLIEYCAIDLLTNAKAEEKDDENANRRGAPALDEWLKGRILLPLSEAEQRLTTLENRPSK